jgi:hypothetical protein
MTTRKARATADPRGMTRRKAKASHLRRLSVRPSMEFWRKWAGYFPFTVDLWYVH